MRKFYGTPFCKVVLIFIFGLILTIFCFYIKKNSYYDLDIVMYGACAMEQKGDSPAIVHARAYEMVKHDLGEDKFNLLTSSKNYYRSEIFKSPDNFYSQLPFYRIKPLYNALLSTAHKMGYSPILFSTWLNLACYVMIAFILLFSLIHYIGFYKGYFSTLCFVLTPMVLDTAKNNTPDLLAALFFMSSVLLFMSHSHFKRNVAILLFTALIFVRPENVLFIAVLCPICFYFKFENYSTKYLVTLFVIGIISYVTVVLKFESYSWATLYKHSFSGYIPNLENFNSTLSVEEYIKGFKIIPRSIFFSDFFLLMFLLIFPLGYLKRTNSIYIVVVISILANILLRIILFPDLSIRFYTGYFLTASILFVILIDSIYKSNAREANAS